MKRERKMLIQEVIEPQVVQKKCAVLLVDDDPQSNMIHRSYLLKRELAKGKLFTANSGQEALDRMNEASPDVVLLDYHMESLNGCDVCREIRKVEPIRHCYIIMVSGDSNTSAKIKAINAGADDYLVKPVNADELVARVNRGYVTSQERRNLKLDSFTGLLNKESFKKFLAQEISRSQREKTPLFMLFIDLDNFKQINDTFGHILGDKVIKKTADILRGSIRIYDVVGRFGGDEFIVLLSGIENREAREVAERMHRRIKNVFQSYIVDDQVTNLHVTASIGGTAYRSADKEDLDTFINRADKMVYRSKEGGKDRVTLTT